MPRVIGSQDRQARDVTPQPVVLALVLDATARARIRGALRGHYRIAFFERVADLLAGAAGGRDPIAAIIVEMRDADGRSARIAISRLQARVRVPMLAYCRAGAEHSDEIRTLVLAGVHELIFEGCDDTGIALRLVLERAHRVQVGACAAAALRTVLPTRLSKFVAHVTAHPEAQTVSDVAHALGCHRRTLVNQCARERLPSPKELLGWCRITVAAELLATTPRTVESIALQLEFPSDTALRNMMKRYTGLRATEVRAHGGIECVIRALRTALELHRAERRTEHGGLAALT